MSKVIVFATPVFLLLIAIEWAWGLAKGRNTYRLQDAVASIGLGMMSQFTAVFTRLLRVGIYTAVYAHLSLVPLEAAQAFWNTWYGWVLALLFYDLCYYWLHRLGHESAILWAAHVVHHQSQDYNLSTALRQTSSGALLGWVFYIPMALAGVPPAVFGVVALVDLLYQFWVHTEHVPKLGWFDRWFCSPSNHRVHHAVNDVYIDKNYGGILVVWDRLFGSFKEEGERCIYGTRSPLRSWDPLWANAEVYAALFRMAWHTRSWVDKVRVFVKPPGWQPPDLAARSPKPAFDLAAAQHKFEACITPAAQRFGVFTFVLLLGAVSAFLWWADGMSPAARFVGVVALSALLWCTTAVLQGRLDPWLGAAGWAAVVAMAGATFALLAAAAGQTDAAQAWQWLHRATKPLGVGLAVVYVGLQQRAASQPHRREVRALLVAMVLSVMGDAWLMFPGFFIQGLVSFLLAHLAFIVAFAQRGGWLPSRGALALTVVYGAAMTAYLWPHLPAALRGPVAAYVLVIAVMGAQALGRSAVLRDAPSRWVALGSVLFMASDSLLALNRFVAPIALSPLWILGTYFTAQLLIARFTLAGSYTRDSAARPGALHANR